MKTQNFLDIFKNKRIIIFGAGKIGRRIYQSLQTFGLKTDFFWDNNADKIRKFARVSILKPEPNIIPVKKRQQYIIIVTIFAQNVSKDITNILCQTGYSQVIYDRKIINSIIYLACKQNLRNKKFSFNISTCQSCPVSKENSNCDIFSSNISQKFAKGVNNFLNKQDKLVVPKIGILISNKCTLTCKGCNHLRDLYRPGDVIEFTTDEILHSLKKIIESVDLINQVTVVGGEPFLHPDFFEIFKKILALPKIGIIQIITNGTVIPKNPRIFNLMSDKRVIVDVSGYGENIPRKFQENVKIFLDKLKKYKINHQYMNTLQWFDFGNFSKRKYTKKQHHHNYLSCCFISNDIFNGKLYKCSRSVFATYLGKIPDYPKDYIDLHKYTKDKLRRELIKFFHNEYLQVCLHCNGVSTLMPDVGSQIHKE